MAWPKPFRFGVQSRSIGPRDQWLSSVRRIEELGYASLMTLDHFPRGLDPIANLAAAAIATTSLKLGSFVFDNDFRHPVVLAKAAATIDVLSGGRLILGIGAGWLKEEYDQSGIPFDAPGIRIERMTEAVRLMKRVFVEDQVTHHGTYYRTENLKFAPKAVQQPHPPILIGGGSKRVLSVAAREADIVGITTRALPDGSKDTQDMVAESVGRKTGWIKEAAGDRIAEIELNIICATVEITNDRNGVAERLAPTFGVTPQQLLESPSALIGTVDQIAETLQERRDRFGLSFVVILEPVAEAFAPVVARLSGQ